MQGIMDVRSVVLEGPRARLEPLAREHHAALCEIGLDPELWTWTVSDVRTRPAMMAWIDDALRVRNAGYGLPFVIRDLESGRIAGSTRFGNIDRLNRRVEIGWTWIGREFQRTPLNTECKYLLLEHAFGQLGCIRVELKTDVLNERSRAAIARLGAVEEGVLRRHAITATGRVRDTIYYSVIAEEWPSVRARLEAMLARPWPPERPQR
jgi:RimJ/RimL family protein N-acetyltransferase